MKVILSIPYMLLLIAGIAVEPALTQAQPKTAIITRYDVRAAYQVQFGQALYNYVARANASQYNIMAELYTEQDNHLVFWMIERWSSGNAYQKMLQTEQARAIAYWAKRSLTKPASAQPVIDLEPYASGDWNKTAGDTGSLTIMLFVDARPETENIFKDVYHIAMPLFRSEQGVINYQLSQFEDDKTRFVTYEKFRNEDAFQYHLNFAPIQPVLSYLNTSIRKQPFQTGLHRLKAYQPAGW